MRNYTTYVSKDGSLEDGRSMVETYPEFIDGFIRQSPMLMLYLMVYLFY
jgi:hypothetical protein